MKAWIKKIFVLSLFSMTVAQAKNIEVSMSSTFLARGERSLMEVRVTGLKPDKAPDAPDVEGVLIQALGFGPPEMVPGRRIVYSYQYVVSSYAVGNHVIPAFDVVVGGVTERTAETKLRIFDPSDLEWKEAVSTPATADDSFRYASIINTPPGKMYKNQSVESEIKVYVPESLARVVADWGIPEFERDGLAVWRFEPSRGRGRVNLLGEPYVGVSYTTTMTALRAGMVRLGPASVRLTYIKMVFDRFAQRMEVQSTLDVPQYEFEISPLPPNAPDGFKNAVGEFQVGTAIKQLEVVQGDPLALDIIISGKGNLDTIEPPRMTDSEGWKIYDATANQRGEERRDLTGVVVFNQFIRPLEMKAVIPSFKLVYFNPEEEQYKVVTTEEIPIKMTPAALGRNFEASGPVQVMPVPVERMTDILGIVRAQDLLIDRSWGFPWRALQVIFILIAFGLIAKALWMRFGHLFERDEQKAKMKKEFQELARIDASDGIGFLRRSGRFTEKWLRTGENEELHQILEERDRLCFRSQKDGVELPLKRRRQILQIIRKSAFSLLIVVALGVGTPQLHAQDTAAEAEELFDAAHYEKAAKLWLGAGKFEELSADTLYNIGTAAYEMGGVGQAALYYRRALVRDETHVEARQNLRFIERKYGSITVDRPDYQYVLAKLPLSSWRGAIYAGAWIFLIGLLIFPATHRGSTWRAAGVVALILAPLIISGGMLGNYHYPNDAKFASLERQAVIIGEGVVLHSDAARTSPEVIDAPAGSLAEVLQRSGGWAYIGFASQTRGWVPAESLEMILPIGKPEPPKIRKSASDSSSA